MRRDDVLAVADRVAHAVMLSVREQADRAPEGLEHLVAAGARDDAVENAVLGDECGLVFDLRLHPLDRLLHFAKVVVGALLRRLGGERRLDDLARLQHGHERHIVEAQVDGQAVREQVEARPPEHEAAAGAGALLEHALRLQNADAFAQRRPADVELLQQLGLGREGLAGLDLRLGNSRKQFLRDLPRLAEIRCRTSVIPPERRCAPFPQGGEPCGAHCTTSMNRGGRRSANAASPSE